MVWSQFTTFSIGLVVFGAFVLALLIQLFYYLGVFSRLAYYKKKDIPQNFPPASIIICARNEDDNLVEFLPRIFEQDYPDFEVVVVNDCSFDNSADILKEFAYKHSNLKIVTIKEDETYSHGKKIALMMGIKGASNEHLLLTDADCKPRSKDWLKNMMQHFTGETEIVIGYGAYEKQKGFVNKLIRFDTFFIALQYLSFSIAGKTYMGTGRNLAYKKSLFFKMKGFASHYHIESGDDDLFVNEAATKRNSQVEISIDTHTISRVKRTFKDWFRQKRRHVTTFKHYNSGSKFRLALLSISLYLFYATFAAVLILQFQPIIVLSLFALRLLIQLIIFNKSMKLLAEKDLLLFSPLIELILLMVYPFITFFNMFVRKNKWK
ncbi:MAG: glycosyl transferase family 2 [Bacteroidetes bacterium]|jgi:cellulose synthase/poly-beta-1,6-N-acetylglucosamine synthase-like glycosyltransferase|nr:glycosyl transferase family 2 [Bacteroidota bacterium]